MKRRRWTRETSEKVKTAARLRRETVVTVAWIAERLGMGSVANVNTLLCTGGKQLKQS
jgi:hypothetical protein